MGPEEDSVVAIRQGGPRVFLALPELGPKSPWRALFAVGVFAGLRPGEIRAFQWQGSDFDTGLISIRRSVDGALKDDDSRVVPMGGTLRTRCATSFPETFTERERRLVDVRLHDAAVLVHKRKQEAAG